MFNEDADFKKLIPIAPSIIYEMREEYRAKFDIIVNEMKHFVLKKSGEKQSEIAQIRECIKNVKKSSDSLCLIKLEDFQHKKKEVLYYDSTEMEKKLNLTNLYSFKSYKSC